MIIEMPVPEKEIGDVRLGFPITIKVPGIHEGGMRLAYGKLLP